MPNQEHLLQIFDMLNNSVDNVSDIKEQATKSKGCWDDDTLFNLSFTNIRVASTDYDANHKNQDQGVYFVTKVWKVQGVSGTNQLKTKRKIKNNLRTSDVANAPIIKAEEKPVLVKNCMKNLNLALALASATSKSVKITPTNLQLIGTHWTGGSFILTAVSLTILSSLRKSLRTPKKVILLWLAAAMPRLPYPIPGNGRGKVRPGPTSRGLLMYCWSQCLKAQDTLCHPTRRRIFFFCTPKGKKLSLRETLG